MPFLEPGPPASDEAGVQLSRVRLAVALGRWVLALLCLAAPLRPAPPPAVPEGRLAVRAVTTFDGLPQNAVQALAMDRTGRLWVGTTGGPAFQDGSGWTSLEVPDQAGSDYVSAILCASDDSLWIARQDGGVSRRSKGVWTTFAPRTGWIHPRVNALAESTDAQGRPLIWAGTHGAGLARWDGRSWRMFTTQDGLPNDVVWRMFPGLGPDGRPVLFIGTDGGGVGYLEGERFVTLPPLPKASVNSFLQSTGPDGRRVLWAGTYGFGVARWDGSAWTRFTQKDGLPSDFITDFAETREADGTSTLWVATLRGLAIHRQGRWDVLDARTGLPGNVMYRLLATRTGAGVSRLWVGTGGHGLFILDPSGWRKVDRSEGLPDSSVHAVAQVDGDLYAGTALGLARYRSGRWEPIYGQERITAIKATGPPGRRTLWVGTLGGLARFEGGRWTLFDQGRDLRNNRITDVVEARGPSGRPAVWVTTDGGGLSCLDQGRWHHFGPPDGPAPSLHTALETSSPAGSYLWVGSRGAGIFRRNPDGSWSRFGKDHGLPNLNILAFQQVTVRGGRIELWAATFGRGIVRLDLAHPDGPWRALALGESAGSTYDMVQGILQHPNGEVYLTSVRGIVRLIPSTESPSGFAAYPYSMEDGLPSEFCSARALALDASGRICVGTVEGLAFLDVRHSPPDQAPKPLLFRGFHVNGAPLPDLDSAPVILKHTQNDVSLHFSLLALGRTREHRFRSQLEGLETAATDWTPNRTREFIHLPPGSYRLAVWGRDHSGRVTGPAYQAFTILPAPWQTWWFRSLLALLALLAVWGVMVWRERLMRVRHEVLRLEVARKTSALQAINSDLEREVRDRRAAELAKEDFTAMVSHELRTPLTAIRGSLGLLLGSGGPPDEATRHSLLDMAHRNALRLLTLVNDLLDMRKIESGRLDLELAPVGLADLMDGARVANQGYFDECDVSLDLLIPAEPCPIMVDPVRFDQTLANLLSNAAKFSPRGATVTVRAERLGAMVRIRVHNPGDPIPEAFRDRLFQKFSQADSGTTRSVRGTGLGLAISKALVEGMGGHIGFETGEGGTTFWVEVPVAEAGGR